MTNLERAVKDLQDNPLIISEIERRTDQNRAEITDKIDGLIGYVSDQRPPCMHHG